MKRKLILTMLLLVTFWGMSAIYVSAESVTMEQGDFTYSIDSTTQTAAIISNSKSYLMPVGTTVEEYHVPGKVQYQGATYQVVSVSGILLPYPKIVYEEGIKEINGIGSLRTVTSEIYFPASLQRASIRNGKDESLKKVVIAPGNTTFTFENGMLINHATQTLVWAPLAVSDVTIPTGVVNIDEDAFRNNDMVNSLTMPDTITTIDKGAFDGCKSLKKIHLSASLKELGNTFSLEDSVLTELVIPKGVSKLSPTFVNKIKTLKRVKVAAGNGAYRVKSNMVTSQNYKKLICPAKMSKKFTIPKGVTSVVKSAFEGNHVIEDVVIKAKIKKIPDRCFQDSEISSIIMPSSVTSIGKNAFFGAECLNKVTLSKNLKVISEGAFNMSGLRKLTIPAKVRKIQKEALQFSSPIKKTSLTFKGKTPPSIYKNNPKNDGDGDFFWIGKIQVPKKSMAKYKKAFKLFRYNKMIGK